jgi:large subunit GTPase 1
MGRPTSKKTLGLGKSLLNDQYKHGKNVAQSSRHAADSDNYGSNANLRSITQERPLDEFLSTAELANTDFTAEKQNVKIIATGQINPYLLSPEQERQKREKHRLFVQSLTILRRPPWTSETTPTELDRNEKDAFLDWRRHLAELQDNHDLLLTPFERNLEVWRQLWRVIERSHLVVQIVDARDPLLFRSTDLENYVKEIDQNKRNLLLVNKADLMTPAQRRAWARYFDMHGIRYSFFSAHMAEEEIIERRNGLGEAKTMHQAEKVNGKSPQSSATVEVQSEAASDDADSTASVMTSIDGEHAYEGPGEIGMASKREEVDPEILSIGQLEQLFIASAPPAQIDEDGKQQKLSIGLVGYPNVGKSSTINALIGAKTVSVSSTPGKTKHFQTIQLSEQVVLVDCPGLVFPNFASSQADLVCAGVLPIDQLREYTGPAALVAKRIPRSHLEAVYGISISVRSEEEGGLGVPTGEELLSAYALSRGFTKAGQGNPDESRAARYVLKDYVLGKLLYVEPPPDTISGADFNREIYATVLSRSKRHAPVSHVPANASTYIAHHAAPSGQVDASFFDHNRQVNAKIKGQQSLASRGAQGNVNGKVIMYPYQERLNNDGSVKSAVPTGKMLTGRKARAMAAVDAGLNEEDDKNSKKHFKANRKQKTRPTMY